MTPALLAARLSHLRDTHRALAAVLGALGQQLESLELEAASEIPIPGADPPARRRSPKGTDLRPGPRQLAVPGLPEPIDAAAKPVASGAHAEGESLPEVHESGATDATVPAPPPVEKRAGEVAPAYEAPEPETSRDGAIWTAQALEWASAALAAAGRGDSPDDTLEACAEALRELAAVYSPGPAGGLILDAAIALEGAAIEEPSEAAAEAARSVDLAAAHMRTRTESVQIAETGKKLDALAAALAAPPPRARYCIDLGAPPNSSHADRARCEPVALALEPLANRVQEGDDTGDAAVNLAKALTRAAMADLVPIALELVGPGPAALELAEALARQLARQAQADPALTLLFEPAADLARAVCCRREFEAEHAKSPPAGEGVCDPDDIQAGSAGDGKQALELEPGDGWGPELAPDEIEGLRPGDLVRVKAGRGQDKIAKIHAGKTRSGQATIVTWCDGPARFSSRPAVLIQAWRPRPGDPRLKRARAELEKGGAG